MNTVTYTCEDCGMVITFYPEFVMTCHGWYRHAFAPLPKPSEQ